MPTFLNDIQKFKRPALTNDNVEPFNIANLEESVPKFPRNPYNYHEDLNQPADNLHEFRVFIKWHIT